VVDLGENPKKNDDSVQVVNTTATVRNNKPVAVALPLFMPHTRPVIVVWLMMTVTSLLYLRNSTAAISKICTKKKLQCDVCTFAERTADAFCADEVCLIDMVSIVAERSRMLE
jgi:hypothetical protein